MHMPNMVILFAKVGSFSALCFKKKLHDTNGHTSKKMFQSSPCANDLIIWTPLFHNEMILPSDSSTMLFCISKQEKDVVLIVESNLLQTTKHMIYHFSESMLKHTRRQPLFQRKYKESSSTCGQENHFFQMQKGSQAFIRSETFKN